MNSPARRWIATAIAALSMAASLAPAAHAAVIEKSTKVDGVTVSYKVVLPADYDASKTYPAVLVFGGGPQTMNTVDRTLERNFRAEAERRGYIVIAPSAPNGQLFFEGGARIFPEFLELILADYRIQDGTFHVAGPSNGGIAAFHVAAAHPQYFKSVTAFPGYLWQPTRSRLEAISTMCVFMYVGENDQYRWHNEMKSEAETLRAMGSVARYTVEQGQPHGIATLTGAQASRLFENFEETKKGCAR